MKKTELEALRQQLVDFLARLRSDAASVTEQTLGPSGGQGDGALTNAPFHLGDAGTEEFLHDVNAALTENAEYLVRESQAALARFDRGTYGECEGCGKSIAVERLRAMPYVRYCVKCAAVNGSGVDVNLNTGRPLKPDDTIAPEGGMQEDWRPTASPFAEDGGRSSVAPDIHAVGTPGGGAAMGGLAGTNAGHGDPAVSDLHEAAGSSHYDSDDARDADESDVPRSGRSGGAVGGTPARKRAK